MSLRLYMDVHVPQGITDGLRARKVQVITAQEDGHREVDDEILLARAGALNCVLFSRDEDLLGICSRWQRTGRFFAGLIFAEQVTVTIGQCIRDLALIAEAATPEEMANRVEFLPL